MSELATIDCGGVAVLDWLPEELVAWEMPELIPTWQWVERYVRIPSRDAAIPGPVDLSVTPYLRGIFDAVDDPLIETITLVCGTQIGKSTFLAGTILSLIVQRPGPILLVLPTEPDAREVAGGTLRNLTADCEPVMREAIGGREALMKEGYLFRSTNVYFGWSNSAASLARRSCRYVFYDEVEKFPPFVGRESDPIRLGDARLRTYRNTTGAKSVRVSSPTTEDGLIGRSWSASDQRRFWVPCPACDAYQSLVWAQVTWPHDEAGHSIDADRIRDDDLARYRCVKCGHDWTDAERHAAVRSGVWAPDGQTVDASGRARGKARRPHSRHAGFHVSALCSSFVQLSQLAAEWVEVQHDLSGLMAFVNQELGEFWEERETEITEEPLRKHVGLYSMGTAPRGVQVVTAMIDVQRGWFVVEARGWGYGLESWLLDARYVETEEQLHDYLRDKRFPRVEDSGKPVDDAAPENAPLAIQTAAIDSGDQTAYVYDLVQAWSDLDLRPTKGLEEIRGALKVRPTPLTKSPRTRRAYRRVMMLYTFDSGFWKDTQARLAAVSEPGPGYFHLPRDLFDQWFKQFTAEVKVPDRRRGRAGRSGIPKRVWRLRAQRALNHYWDCAVGNCVLTDEQLLNLRRLPNPAEPPPPRPRRRFGRMPSRYR